MHEVPDSLPVTEEARERLREQANQLPPATVVRLIDLLAVAVDDMRQGGDPRLPLELALVKVTRPASDLSRESLAFRLERLEEGAPAPNRQSGARRTNAVDWPPSRPPRPSSRPRRSTRRARAAAGGLARSILPAVEQRSIPIGKTLGEAHPPRSTATR